MAASADDSAWFLLGSGVESQEASSVLKFRLAKASARAGGQEKMWRWQWRWTGEVEVSLACLA